MFTNIICIEKALKGTEILFKLTVFVLKRFYCFVIHGTLSSSYKNSVGISPLVIFPNMVSPETAVFAFSISSAILLSVIFPNNLICVGIVCSFVMLLILFC